MATNPLPTDRMPQVKVMLYTSKLLADGSHPLRLRITKDGGRKYISLGESCPATQWDTEKEAPRRSHPDRTRLQTLIKKWETTYLDAARRLQETGHPFTIDMLIETVSEAAKRPTKAARGTTLLSYLQHLVSEMEKAKKVGNANVYKDTRRVLSKFLSAKDCLLSTVNVAFLNRFETSLRSEGVADTTLSLYFRTLRAAINRAISEGLIQADLYPFSRHKTQRDKYSVSKFDLSTRKRAISKDNIRTIEVLDVDTSRLLLAKHIFIFSYYGGGINFVDMAMLKWRDVHGNRLQYTRQKTGGLFNLKLTPAALQILNYYRPLTATGLDAYVFPILSKDRHISPKQIDNRLHKMNGQINLDLKAIGLLAGIETPLTTYVARHSFATALKRSGVATAIISESMGHKTESITQTYLASFENELIDDAFDNL